VKYAKLEKARLNGEVNCKYFSLDPKDLSNDQLGDIRNLNKISHDTAIALIRATLDEGTNLKEVFMDTVGPPDKYRLKLEQEFSEYNIKFVVESKADANYKCVSAASIVAKINRDRMLRDWKFIEPDFNSGGDKHRIFGCGYPGDGITKTWLRAHYDSVFGFPTIVRFSWSTCDRIINISDKCDNKGKVSCVFHCGIAADRQFKEITGKDYEQEVTCNQKHKRATGIAKKINLENF